MTTAASSFAELSASITDLAVAAAPSIVEVQSQRSLASGFAWRDGLVITPDETLAEEGSLQIEESDGTVRNATLVGRDAATDIALLRVTDLKAPAAPLATPVGCRGGRGTPLGVRACAPDRLARRQRQFHPRECSRYATRPGSLRQRRPCVAAAAPAGYRLRPCRLPRPGKRSAVHLPGSWLPA